MHLKILEGPPWTLLCISPPGTPARVALWLAAYKPQAVHVGPGPKAKFLRAQFATLPKAWASLHADLLVRHIELTPDGYASLFVEDSLARVRNFLARLPGTYPGFGNRRTQAGPEPVRLTARQMEALSLAVALGYYETPHRVSLRTLAKRLGLGVGSTSQLIRRAQALIITHYMDSQAASQWDTPEGRRRADDEPDQPKG